MWYRMQVSTRFYHCLGRIICAKLTDWNGLHWFTHFFSNSRGARGHVVMCHLQWCPWGCIYLIYISDWMNINFKALHAFFASAIESPHLKFLWKLWSQNHTEPYIWYIWPMVDITKSIDPWRVLAECASGAKAVVAMDSFRAWKAPVAPGEKPSPLEMSPEYGADGAGMCWYVLVIKKSKKTWGDIQKTYWRYQLHSV